MALTRCRECGERVSTEAVACPHCGCPHPANGTPVPAGPFVESTQSAAVPQSQPEVMQPVAQHVPLPGGRRRLWADPPDGAHPICSTPPSQPAGLTQWPSLPPFWPGFLLAAARLCCELCLSAAEALDAPWFARAGAVVSFAALAYWLYSVYALHWALLQATDGLYPVMPLPAALGHLVPLYNLYWVFRWPNHLARFVRQQRGPGRMPMNLPGLALLTSLLLGCWDGALGLAALFAFGLYVRHQARLALQAQDSAAERGR